MDDFPTSYTIVRQGRPHAVQVNSLEELIDLRSELEIVRRFGAGANLELLRALDRCIAQLGDDRPDDASEPATRIEGLEDMRAILCDALSPVNGETTARIDREWPRAKAGVNMASIDKDSAEFRQDLAKQLEAGGEDVDALLAAFEEAALQEETSSNANQADTELDADLQALLTATSDEDPDEAALSALAASIGLNDDLADEEPASDGGFALSEASSVDDQSDEPQAAHAETDGAAGMLDTSLVDVPQAVEETACRIDEVAEQMTERLSSAEEQLGAIASAFEMAAAELGQASGENLDDGESACAASGQTLEDVEDSVFAAGVTPAAETVAARGVIPPPPEPSERSADMRTGLTAQPSTPFASSPASATSPSATRSAAQLRGQLQQARANILSELDDLLVLLERVDQMQGQADASLRKACDFERAAARALQCGQGLAAAEAEAAKARAQFEQAQARVGNARQAWEQAQQEAATAASMCG